MLLTCYQQGSSCPDRTISRYYRYDAYGQPKAYAAAGSALAWNTPLVGNYSPDLLYTGQRWDWQVQLHYYGARFYDPKLATFLTADPLLADVNPYAYVGWNPANRIDPTGLGDLSDCDPEFQVCFSGSSPGYDPWSGGGYIFDPWAGANDPWSENFRLGGGVFEGGYYSFPSGGVYSGYHPVSDVFVGAMAAFDQSFSIGGERYGAVEAGSHVTKLRNPNYNAFDAAFWQAPTSMVSLRMY